MNKTSANEENMKTYLVACNLGEQIKAYTVRTEASYVPASDNMKTLKELVVKIHKPRTLVSYANPPECGGYIGYTDGKYISAKRLNIIAVSRLDL